MCEPCPTSSSFCSSIPHSYPQTPNPTIPAPPVTLRKQFPRSVFALKLMATFPTRGYPNWSTDIKGKKKERREAALKWFRETTTTCLIILRCPAYLAVIVPGFCLSLPSPLATLQPWVKKKKETKSGNLPASLRFVFCCCCCRFSMEVIGI